jgi:hypothetical protein
MKKIILTAVLAFTFLYAGLIDFSYADDLAKGISELTGTEMAEENIPINLAQANTSTEDEKVEVEEEDEKVEVEKDDEPDEDEVEDVDDETVEVGVEGIERRRIRERR